MPSLSLFCEVALTSSISSLHYVKQGKHILQLSECNLFEKLSATTVMLMPAFLTGYGTVWIHSDDIQPKLH